MALLPKSKHNGKHFKIASKYKPSKLKLNVGQLLQSLWV